MSKNNDLLKIFGGIVVLLALFAVAQPGSTASNITFQTTLDSFTAVQSPVVGTGFDAQQNAINYVAGQVGQAAYSSSSSGYLRVAQTDGTVDNINLNAGTVEFWLKSDHDSSAGLREILFSSGEWGSTGNFTFGKHNQSNNNQCAVLARDSSNNTREHQFNCSWTAGQWTKIRVAWDWTASPSIVRFWQDDVELSPSAVFGSTGSFTPPPPSTSNHIYVASRMTGAPDDCDCTIDELTIWDGVTVPSGTSGPDLNALFQAATSTEISNIKADWTSRNIGVVNASIVSTESYTTQNGISGEIRVIEHEVDGYTHYGFVFVPSGTPAGGAAINLHMHPADAGGKVDPHLEGATQTLGPASTPFVYVVPAFRGEPLDVNGTIYNTTGPISYWDRDTDDALALLEVVKTMVPEVDPSMVFVTGTSRGGLNALLAGIRDPQVDGVATKASPTDFFETSIKNEITNLANGGTSVYSQLNWMNTQFIQPWVNGLLPLADMRAELIRRSATDFPLDLPPTQIHHGDSDTTVSVGQAHSLISTMSNLGIGPPNFEGFIYPGGTHNTSTLVGADTEIQNFVDSLFSSGADTTPPTTSITSPADSSTVSGIISIDASATDDVAVASVEFFVDGVSIGTDTTSPYSVSWDTTTVADGSYSLATVATDTSGNTGASAAVNVTVDNAVSDTTPPSVSITSPADGSTVSGIISIDASATDDVAVASVEFFVDGVSIGTDTTSPYSVSWDTTTVADGSYSLATVATDTSGNTGASAAVNVTVDNAVSDTTPPSVSITSPADGSTVSGIISIDASATDDVAVASVEFFVDGVSIGTDTTSPYSVSWDTTTVADGSYSLTAEAVDTSSNTTLSSAVGVTVDNLVLPSSTILFQTTLDSFTDVQSPVVGTGFDAQQNGIIYVPGQIGRAAHLDSKKEYIRVAQTDGTTDNINLGTGTVEFWFKSDLDHDTNRYRAIMFSSGEWGSIGRLTIGKHNQSNNNQCTVLQKDNSGKNREHQFNCTWSAGQWTKIRVAWDWTASPNIVRFWQDDVELSPTGVFGSTTAFTQPQPSTSDHLYIGSRSTNSPDDCDCTIDELTVWDSVETP